MSGLAGIVNVDGAPMDRRVLSRMTDALAHCGPDARRVWIDGNVGFGHAMLRTSREAERETQPYTLDGDVWITADARIDDRRELLDRLKRAGRVVRGQPTDAELLLHAYGAWGEGCVAHLIGDFAFAIWDGRRRRLFCACDHFGIKPLYYARANGTFVFSNVLDCVRAHPDVSDRLNERAIGDFLLFDINQNPATTTCADVQRVPPAHSLTLSDGHVVTTRYWSLPVDEPIRYKRSQDYVEHFRELLHAVVADRVRDGRVAIYMSGGLDSTTAAAAAAPLCDAKAFTVVYDSLIPDEERRYSTIAAGALGIPIQHLAADDYDPCQGWNTPEQRRPEPQNDPLRALHLEQLKRIAGHGRVALYCEGPDNLLHYEWRPYVAYLARQRGYPQLLKDVARYVRSQRRLPFIGRITGRVTGLKGGVQDVPSCPPWLNEGFASRARLAERWTNVRSAICHSGHPLRPLGAASLALAEWRRLFERHDAGVTGVPVDVRYPFMDLRMVRYLLAVPAVPWCAHKQLLRESMRGSLPELVRRRRKTPLVRDPVSEYLESRPTWWRQKARQLSPQVFDYVDPFLLRHTLAQGDTRVWTTWMNLRPLALDTWLTEVRTAGYPSTEAPPYEAATG